MLASDDDNNCYGIFVRFKASTNIHMMTISIVFDMLNYQTRYCYRNLLHKENKRDSHDSNVKFTELHF